LLRNEEHHRIEEHQEGLIEEHQASSLRIEEHQGGLIKEHHGGLIEERGAISSTVIDVSIRQHTSAYVSISLRRGLRVTL
jgi:hypothetical protein